MGSKSNLTDIEGRVIITGMVMAFLGFVLISISWSTEGWKVFAIGLEWKAFGCLLIHLGFQEANQRRKSELEK